MSRRIAVLLSASVALAVAAEPDGPVGERPYEMVWADRTEDIRPALVDFEDLNGWTVECHDAEASLESTRRQQLWGKYVGTLTYRGSGPQPRITLRPPEPFAIPAPLNSINFWVYGNNWAWAPDQSTPQVNVAVLLGPAGGPEVPISMGRVRWKEWWVMHRRLAKEQLDLLADAPLLLGIQVSGGRNRDDRVLHFDNLAFYVEQLPPLEFQPRPKRGVEMFPGQSAGTNFGPGQLPFPTREETILPDNLTDDFEVTLQRADQAFEFHYRGSDGHLVYRYQPATGTLGDVTAHWVGRSSAFQPLVDGGVRLVSTSNGDTQVPQSCALVDCRNVGDAVESTWRCTSGNQTAEVTYALRLWQKSLIVDVRCRGGHVAEFRLGRAVGVDNPRLVTLPYLTCGAERPAVLVTGSPEEPLFLSGLMDFYRSNASELWAANRVSDDGAVYNGGSRYLPKTDGRRNDCFERLFLTVSPRFEEVLPNVANPKSPWMDVAGERLWRAHGAGDRQRDYAQWKEIARYGMTKVVITDHETGWRDGGESFTLRTRAAPGKGGDEGQAEYAKKIRALGFRYGIYNNYTDFAPVNGHWDEDYVTRLPDGEWRTAWARCYNLKPARAVELESRLAPIIQEKFHLDTAYCDVHTAVAPWSYCDFDARVPGAGTFAATLYAYGEIMLHQKETWNGPVYSEGNNHWYYCGLTDGNYGQDQVARLDERPWLVDFDLRKLHPLSCNFGMGNLGMFYGRKEGLGRTPGQREARLDRFMAATLAFGHTGFLVLEGGISNAVRSYFNLQQVHAHYAQATVDEIRYADEHGNMLDPSAAVATGAYQRSQVETRYANGVTVIVNGHPHQTWKRPEAELPPNGWYAAGSTPEGPLTAFSAMVDGHRADYIDSPAYVYADGRGRFTRFEKAACDGQMIAHRRPDGSTEVIPVGECSAFAVSMGGQSAMATALDAEHNELGPAEVRLARGLVHPTPVEGAFSYLLEPAAAPPVEPASRREQVVPGETVEVKAAGKRSFQVPTGAAPGERLWERVDEGWIDFTVVPLVDAELTVDDSSLVLHLTPHVASTQQARVTLAGQSQDLKFEPDRGVRVAFAFEPSQKEEVREIPLEVVAGDLAYRRRWWLKAEDAVKEVAPWPEEMQTGRCLRVETERPIEGKTRAAAHWTERTCGESAKKCLFMHPPYVSGVGYTFAEFGPLELPREPKAAFRATIGKGDGSDPGDGILFRVAVREPEGSETVVAEKPWRDHAWTPIEADLSPWAGRSVQLKLIADVGPADNSSGDWACWADMRVQSARPETVLTVHDKPVQLQREPAPLPNAGLTLDDLRRARSGTLHFQAIGLQNGGRYVSHARLNDVPLGPLPSASGSERHGAWSDASLPLVPEALAGLNEWNVLSICNPGNDSFKIGRVWIELKLPDGRTNSSQITATVFTQPPEWPYAEGTGVPFGREIETLIRFRVQ